MSTKQLITDGLRLVPKFEATCLQILEFSLGKPFL